MSSSESERASKNLYVSDLKPDARGAVERQLWSLTDASFQAAMDCGFEVIKHLAIFNGAGLAAAATIAQVVATDVHAKSISMQGAHAFVIGLVFALLAMVMVYITGIIFVRHLLRSSLEFILGLAPMSAVKPRRIVYGLIIFNWVIALISIGCFLFGALRIAAIG